MDTDMTLIPLNRSAIMRDAHAKAREQIAKMAALGCDPWPYAKYLKHALRDAWSEARLVQQIAQDKARYAAMSVRERAIADLEAAKYRARMIDSTTRMFAEMAAIDAQIAILRAAA